MAGNIGDAISQTIPTVGSSGTQYATDIDAFLTEVKGRLNVKVPRASLAAGALDLASNALQNASYVSIASAGGTPTTPASSIQQNGGNLYWVTASGQVQITSGNALNIALANGITGDYGGVNPAQFRFVDADQEYYAYDDYAGAAWARLWAKNFDLAAGATSANRVRMAFGGGGSYTLTMPTALPSATKIVQLDSAGQLTATGTVTGQRNVILRAALAYASVGSTSDATNAPQTTVAINSTVYFPLSGVVTQSEMVTGYTIIDGGNGATVSLATLSGLNYTVPTQSSPTFTGSGTAKTNTITTPALPSSTTGIDNDWWLKVVTVGSTFIANCVLISVSTS